MKLEQDIVAPIFKVKDIYGSMIDLEQYQEKKVYIGFFRHAGCPFCNTRIHSLIKLNEELKNKEIAMIFFFESKEYVLLNSNFHREISPIPIISDPLKKWYNAYGLESSGTASAISHITSFVQTAYRAYTLGLPIYPMADGESIKTLPAEFLIDKGLKIRQVHYSFRLNDRMSMDKIQDFANSEDIN